MKKEGKKKKTAGVSQEETEEELITIDDFAKVKLQVGVIKAERHPDADKLLVFQVKVGEERRQIVSGIKSGMNRKV